MLLAIVACSHAFVPPSTRADLSRRSAIVTGLAAPLGQLARPQDAVASTAAKEALKEAAAAREAQEAEEKIVEGDPLTLALMLARKDLATCGPLLENREWDKVRKISEGVGKLLTFRGYTGESVKSRAESWGDAGEVELGKEILRRRKTLAVAINTLENGVFAAQTNNKPKMLSAAELQSSLTASVDALDAVIDKMGCAAARGMLLLPRRWRKHACLPHSHHTQISSAFSIRCDQRWKSGKCEIMPKEKSLGNLVMTSKGF